MKYIFKILIILISALAFTSCSTMSTSETAGFSRIDGTKELEGNYLNRADSRSMLSLFNIEDSANFVTITSENQNELKLVYGDDSSVMQERVFTGEMKKNYFEVHFLNQKTAIPLVYKKFEIDRVRIGKSADGKLLVQKFTDHGTKLLVADVGHSSERLRKFPYAREYAGYIPFVKNGLWGYSDPDGNMVIPPKYDFAGIFEHDVAHVKLNNKWGVINKRGEEIIPVKYDKISFLNTVSAPYICMVLSRGKTGVFDVNGNELIPAIYDYVGYPRNPNDPVSIRLGDNWGLATRTRVVIPAIYSELGPGTLPALYSVKSAGVHGLLTFGKRNGKYYAIDNDGYEYETRTRGIGPLQDILPIPNTKRKIQFDEQQIE
jgi:hypothetical protein